MEVVAALQIHFNKIETINKNETINKIETKKKLVFDI